MKSQPVNNLLSPACGHCPATANPTTRPSCGRSIVTSLLALSLICSSGFTRGETLLEVYELALKNDLEYRTELASYRAAIEEEAIARGQLLPQISFDAEHSDVDSDAGSAGDTTTETTGYSLTLLQPLIDFAALNTWRSGQVQTLRAQALLASEEQDLIIRSAQAYFEILRAVDQLRTARAEEKALATQLEQTLQRFEVGLIPINDVEQTRAASDSAVANRLSAELDVVIAFEALTIITGKNHESIAPLGENFQATFPEPNNRKAWIEFANKNNLLLQISRLEADIARFDAKAVRANRYPELVGSLSYGNSDASVSGTSSSDIDTDTSSARLDLTIPLFAGGSLSAADRQAAQNQIRAGEASLLAQRNATQRTRALFFAVNNDINQIKARKQAIVSNESALEATQAGYEAGTRDIVDLVDAQSDLFQAQRDYFTALYDYILNSLRLKNEAGILSRKDLEKLENDLQADQKTDYGLLNR